MTDEPFIESFRMRPTAFHVGQARQEDSITLMVVIRLEDEFAPGVWFLPKLHEIVQSLLPVSRSQQVLFQVRRPVSLVSADQDIRCRHGDVVIRQIENRRAKPDVPEFASFSSIARSIVVSKLLVRNQFSQATAAIFDPTMLVDAHA